MFRRHQPRNPATRLFVAANVAIFLLQLVAGSGWHTVQAIFGLSEAGLRHGALWQLVTYQFLHANELHILVNMIGLWLAGRELEPAIGTPRFVALYLTGGVVGGLAQVLFSDGPLIGASGSVCGVLLAFTTLFPRLPITALLFFVLPVRMRAGMLGYLLIAGSVLFWLTGWQPEVGHLAHLGGFATGWVFGIIFRRQFGEDKGSRAEGNFVSSRSGASPTEGDVLAKVLRQGIDSLSREERRILKQSRTWRR